MLRASQSRSGAGSKRRRQCTQQEMAERRNRLHFVREQHQSRTRVGMVRQASENDYSYTCKMFIELDGKNVFRNKQWFFLSYI